MGNVRKILMIFGEKTVVQLCWIVCYGGVRKILMIFGYDSADDNDDYEFFDDNEVDDIDVVYDDFSMPMTLTVTMTCWRKQNHGAVTRLVKGD